MTEPGATMSTELEERVQKLEAIIADAKQSLRTIRAQCTLRMNVFMSFGPERHYKWMDDFEAGIGGEKFLQRLEELRRLVTPEVGYWMRKAEEFAKELELLTGRNPLTDKP